MQLCLPILSEKASKRSIHSCRNLSDGLMELLIDGFQCHAGGNLPILLWFQEKEAATSTSADSQWTTIRNDLNDSDATF